MGSLSPLVADFLLAFAKEASTIFVLYLAVYLAASYVVLSSAHGNTGAWDDLRLRLQAVISSDDVKACKTLKLAAIQSTLSHEGRAELLALVVLLGQIDDVKRRLLLLHQRQRFIGIGVILAVIAGLLSASPALFNQPPISTRIQFFSAIVPAAFAIIFYWAINLRHAEAWSKLQGQVASLNARLQGATLEPL